MPQTKKQKREGALARMQFRLNNPVPSGQDRRVKRNQRSHDDAVKEAHHLASLIQKGQ